MSHWRTESAVAREKADQERERWRLIREQEEKQQAEREREREKQGGVQRKDSEWETVTRSSSIRDSAQSAPKRTEGSPAAKVAAAAVHDTPSHASHSPADLRDLVTGETSRGHGDPTEVRYFYFLTIVTSRLPQDVSPLHSLYCSVTHNQLNMPRITTETCKCSCSTFEHRRPWSFQLQNLGRSTLR